MWSVASIIVQTFEQRSDIGARAEREVLGGDGCVVRGVPEAGQLSGHCARDIDLDRNFVLGDSHGGPPRCVFEPELFVDTNELNGHRAV
jgi:hypothetical protein